MHNSILADYVRDEKNDGTYTLNLNEQQTRELWAKVDAQTVKIEELARDSASAWAARQHLHDFLAPDDDLALAAKRASDEHGKLSVQLADLRAQLDAEKARAVMATTSSAYWKDEWLRKTVERDSLKAECALLHAIDLERSKEFTGLCAALTKAANWFYAAGVGCERTVVPEMEKICRDALSGTARKSEP